MSEFKKRRDLHQEVTDKIVKAIEDGGMASWVRPWSDLNEPGLPKNGVSARPYSGVNTALLFITAHERGYGSNRWFTMKQANEAGGRVRKGEKTTPVYFFKMLESSHAESDGGKRENSSGEKPRMVPFLTEYRVFNAEQIDGLPPSEIVPTSQFSQNDAVQEILNRLDPQIVHGGNRAYFSPSQGDGDNGLIKMPYRGAFNSEFDYLATLLHELGHWTSGPLKRQLGARGTEDYAREEIRVELFSVMMARELNLPLSVENHSAYIDSYVNLLKSDSREIFRVARDAQKICDYAMGRYVPEKDFSPEIMPVVSPAPVIETTVRPVNPLVKSIIASSASRAATRKPKTDHFHQTPTSGGQHRLVSTLSALE
jgi:antirestriction protein ArdC